jgi:hypothetical protein
MDEVKRDRILSSLLWGSVAAAGEHTMLFLSIIPRIHVRFEGQPVFWVDPRGPIALTKDAALSVAWLASLCFGLVVAAVGYWRPRPRRPGRTAVAACMVALSLVASLAEPLWGLAAVVDGMILLAMLGPGLPGPKKD